MLDVRQRKVQFVCILPSLKKCLFFFKKFLRTDLGVVLLGELDGLLLGGGGVPGGDDLGLLLVVEEGHVGLVQIALRTGLGVRHLAGWKKTEKILFINYRNFYLLLWKSAMALYKYNSWHGSKLTNCIDF